MTLAELKRLAKGKPKRRDNARRTWIGNIAFPSGAEAARWVQLWNDFKSGAITTLERQPRFDLIGCGSYTADFRYILADGTTIVEDVKGRDSSESRLRRRLVKKLHGVDVKIVTMGKKTVATILAAAQARRSNCSPGSAVVSFSLT